MDSLVGILYRDWKRLLKQNRYNISAPYLAKSAMITGLSLRNTYFLKKENELFTEQYKSVRLEMPPVFIIGHWRSGTTFLHNLLTRDEQFAYPRVFETNNPSTFLFIGQRFDKVIRSFKDQSRPMDNVIVNRLSPGEEEFAIGVRTLMTPLLGWAFPKNSDYYQRYLTFEDVNDEDIEYWKSEYMLFLRKLTFRYGKRLMLKNPLNTARIRLLLSMFPDAKVIHIHRHPVDVFRSTRKLINTAVRSSRLQSADPESDDLIISRYRMMYEQYRKDLSLLSDNQFIDVAFEDLEADPTAVVKQVYDTLKIGDFLSFQSSLEKYLDGIQNYKKNIHKPIENSLLERLRTEWEESFRNWEYDLQAI